MSGGYSKSGQSGSGTQTTSQSGTSTTTSDPWGPISDFLKSMAPNIANMATTPTPYFPGQGYVAPSAATQYGINQGMNAAQGGMQDVNRTSLGNFNFLSNAADVANNPYVNNMLDVNQQRVTQNFKENLLPSINTGAAKVNAMGSSRQGIAQAQGAERTAQQLANTNKELMMDAYNSGLGAQQNALSQTGAMHQNLLAPSAAAMGMGSAIEGYQSKALDDAMARHNYQYEEPWQRVDNVAKLIGNLFGNYGTSSTKSTGTGTGTTSQSSGGSGFKIGTK